MFKIIDKLYEAGVLWLCLTGGEPLARPDFLKIYRYAKKKGFIITILTSLFSLNPNIVNALKEDPPFSIVVTLKAGTKITYEKITQRGGSFEKVMTNLDKTLKEKLPLKIRVKVIKENIQEVDKIKRLVESKGLKLELSATIIPRLNKDPTPCQYRPSVEDFRNLDLLEEYCGQEKVPYGRLFMCGAGNYDWPVDPHGRLFLCTNVRQPSYDLLNGNLREGMLFLSRYAKSRKFSTDSKCKYCAIRYLCYWCPGRAALEMGNEDEPIPYFCELAHAAAGKINSGHSNRRKP
jgi:radical SAM protein with 4Fe4S-binding SPASM domain